MGLWSQVSPFNYSRVASDLIVANTMADSSNPNFIASMLLLLSQDLSSMFASKASLKKLGKQFLRIQSFLIEHV